MSLEPVIPKAFRKYIRLSPASLLADALAFDIDGNEIIIAAADRASLINFLNRLDPDPDWSVEPPHQVSIAFLKPKEPSASVPSVKSVVKNPEPAGK